MIKFSNTIIIIFVLFFFFMVDVSAQSASVENLRNQINQSNADTLLYQLFDEISFKLSTINPNEGLQFARKQLRLAEKLKQPELLAPAYLNMAWNCINIEKGDSSIYFARKALELNQTEKHLFAILSAVGNAFRTAIYPDSSMHYYTKALHIAQKNNDTLNIAASFNNLGLNYMDIGELQASFENFLNAFKYFEKGGDKLNQAIALNNMGLVNIDIGNYDMAVSYFNQAVAINLELEDNMNLSMNYSNLGVLYKTMEDYDLALEYYNKSLAIAEEFGFANDLARHYHNVGNIYLMKGDSAKAKESYNKSLKISKEKGMEIGELYNNMQIARLEIGQGICDSAEKRMAKVDKLLDKSGMARLRIDYFELMTELEEKRGQFDKALQYHKKFKSYADSMQDVARQLQIEDIQTRYDSEKKSMENEKLKDQDLLNKKIIKNQQLLVLFILISLLFFVLLSINFFRSRQKLSRAFDSLKKLNREVIDQKEKLEEANETKDKIFSIVAHDLRSPFNTLIGFLNILISDFDTMDDDEKKEMLLIVNNESVKTYGLLENLLQWSMVQRGMIDLVFAEMDLYRVIHGQIAELSARAESKQISVINKIEPGIMLYADENICKTIFRNLINNAIKFTPRGGSIQIDTVSGNNYTTVKVSDTGVGMTNAFAKDLFTRNIPQSTRGTDNEVGTGLGLRIVRDFAEMLKAEIRVESRPGEGSSFFISFKNHKTK